MNPQMPNMKNPVRNTLLFISGSIAVAALCLATPSTARAAGLGELLLLSELGQPLNAEIEIVAVQAGDEDLAARLAPSKDFHQAGAEIDPALSGIQFTILRHGVRSVLRISTRQPVNGPYLELPVELKTNNTRVVRQYTVLLNPPSSKDTQRISTGAVAR